MQTQSLFAARAAGCRNSVRFSGDERTLHRDNPSRPKLNLWSFSTLRLNLKLQTGHPATSPSRPRSGQDGFKPVSHCQAAPPQSLKHLRFPLPSSSTHLPFCALGAKTSEHHPKALLNTWLGQPSCKGKHLVDRGFSFNQVQALNP